MAATVGPKRSSQACKRCRQQKMKCTGGPEPCSRCTHMGRECIFEPASSMTAASRTGQGSSNTGAQQRPLVPFSEPPNFSDIQTPMSTDVDQQRPAKRSRLDLRQTTSHDSPHGFMVASPETPYTSVQSLEYQHHIPLSQPPPHSTSSLATPPETARRDGVRTQLVDILTESEISLAEAEQMFRLFGDRIAPFFPLFFNMNFSQLPMSPILGLAALHAIGRYLPDAAAMRLTLWRHLKICLKDLVFEMPERTSVIAVENMQGLAILYGCCEASSPGCSTAWDCLDAPDMLTAKSMAEAYAVKLGVGQLGNPFPNKFLAYVWWLWLYTMSHHAAILHNCVRTLSGIGGIREAKSYVEQTNTHNAVKRLLGEVELVLIWERVHFDGVPSAVKMGEELRMWADSWHDFLNAGDGRQLIFHQRFMTFQLYASLVHTESDLNLLGATRTVRAAQDFLHCTSRLPPVSKERIRYMCDFGFVMIAYACLFILQATRSTTLGDYKTELLRDVQEAANLLQSFSAKKNVRPAIYGYALQKLCEEYAKSALAAHHVAADNNHGVPDSSSASFFASASASTAAEMVAGQTATLGVGPQTTPESTSTFNTTLESPIVPGLGLCPSVEGFLAGDGMEAEVARSMSELWSLNQNFFTFEDEN